MDQQRSARCQGAAVEEHDTTHRGRLCARRGDRQRECSPPSSCGLREKDATEVEARAKHRPGGRLLRRREWSSWEGYGRQCLSTENAVGLLAHALGSTWQVLSGR